MPFGQLVIGPPGSGKTTYCLGMQHYFELTGRKCAIVNLDPANDAVPYECAVDIEELITLGDVMDQHHLGPNGGLIFCIEYLEKNLDWLQQKLSAFEEDVYILIDLPGQVELFVQHDSLRRIVQTMCDTWHYRLTAVHLVDSHLCTDPPKYMSALLVSLSAMLHLELPHVNVLSKIDLIQRYGKLHFQLDFYTEVLDLNYLLQHFDQKDTPFARKYRKLSKGLLEAVEEFGLVNFTTLNIEDKDSVQHLVSLVDKSNGYVFAGLDRMNKDAQMPSVFQYSAATTSQSHTDIMEVQERYVNTDNTPPPPGSQP